MADEITINKYSNFIKPNMTKQTLSMTTSSSAATLATLRSEDSLSPIRTINDITSFSGISCQIRI